MGDSAIVLAASTFVLLVARVPVAFSVGIASMATFWHLGLPPQTGVNIALETLNSFALLALPFFMLLGNLMNDGGITDRLLRVANAFVGHIRGGLGHINILISMMFASVSGSSVADTASVGSIVIPAMKKNGFSSRYAAAITAASSTLGNIIPPSILMVIYGSFGDVSIGALFLGGIVPGIAIGLLQMGYNHVQATRQGMVPSARVSLRELGIALAGGIPVMLIPLIVLGGITSGYFTATEAASIAVVLCALLALGVFRSTRVSALPRLLSDTAVGYSAPLFAIACSGMMGWLIAFLGISDDVGRLILTVTNNETGIYLLLCAFLLFIGTFMSSVMAVIIFLPIIQELGGLAGADPVHLGVVAVIMLSVGLITPPFGVCLLIASQISGDKVTSVAVTVLPLVAIILALVFLLILIPDIVLFLPGLFLG